MGNGRSFSRIQSRGRMPICREKFKASFWPMPDCYTVTSPVGGSTCGQVDGIVLCARCAGSPA